jgi:hypothetical protein
MRVLLLQLPLILLLLHSYSLYYREKIRA